MPVKTTTLIGSQIPQVKPSVMYETAPTPASRRRRRRGGSASAGRGAVPRSAAGWGGRSSLVLLVAGVRRLLVLVAQDDHRERGVERDGREAVDVGRVRHALGELGRG